MAIQKLSQDIINKIAAGEVVERPSSVIKELVENSLDALATRVEIELKNGGRDYIRIQDNGIGMDEQDAKLSIEQHTTSKIHSVNDLFNLNTFGFRGEALASISSVSDFILQTKRQNDLVGFEVCVIDSKINYKQVSCKTGTKIEVLNLFKNIPARKAYLKSASTEYNHCFEEVTRFALARPDVSFVLIHNNKNIFSLNATKPILRIEELFKKTITDAMLEFNFEEDFFKVSGFVGKPHKFFGSKNYQYIFLNGRYIKSPIIHKAILQGYGSLLPHLTQPIYVLNININPEIVDVNVHPRKLEVRFADSQSIFRFIVRAINNVLRTNDLNKQLDDFTNTTNLDFQNTQNNNLHFNNTNQVYKNNFSQNNSINNNYKTSILQNSFLNSENYKTSILQKDSLNFTNDNFEENNQGYYLQNEKNYFLDDWKLLGQIKDSYILVEVVNKGLLIIDQHGADERINYEKLLKEQENGITTKKQQLLLPIIIEVSQAEHNLIIQNKLEFEKLGFEIESFDYKQNQKIISVNSVPTIIKIKDPKKILEEIFDTLLNEDKIESFTIDYILKTLACKSAVKFGDILSLDEQMKLIKDIKENINNNLACAHGRPIILELTWEYLNLRFER